MAELLPSMPALDGVRLAAARCGIKKKGGLDLVLIELPEGSLTTGVFTQNAFCAAPVTVCREHLSSTNNTRYLLINSGNANACTGASGVESSRASCAALASMVSIEPQQVLPFSTGVIGEPLPVEKICNALPEIYAELSERAWELAARGIMTTDTQPKGATATIQYQGDSITVNGIAKGAGMIRPNMATMLGYIVTDAAISPELLIELSKEAANLSFNRITIDGDTSTNDSCTLSATGRSSVEPITTKDHPVYALLRDAVVSVYRQLAQAIVRDAEGATKFITLDVSGGATEQECLDVAYAIAHSPLVKTAFFASDPNWGRIVAAIGYAGLQCLDVNLISVYLDDVLIVEKGGRAQSYTEEAGQRVMNQTDITIKVLLGRGDCRQLLWTSDLSHEYVTINAEYRT